MIPPVDSLLKYDTPILVKTGSVKSPTVRQVRMIPQPSTDSIPIPPPPKSKYATSEGNKLENEEVLDVILPPREWTEGNQLWVQKVSSAPCTRADIIHLKEQLDTKLEQRQARHTGICPIRRELYSQCFDELIRQVTIICAERGLLLLRVRDEIKMTIATYETLYESSIAFGMRKALQAEQGKMDMEKRIADMGSEKQDLMKQLDEQKARCDAIERRETEKRQVEERKYNEEIQFLKKTNQQLKTQLEGMITPRK
ncbi:axonemal dynein light intermediate polypeptide 1 isoform X1 [Girardinichthys multiradiatus]|uniref:axonemal dynein light intermediate polypeptide 1 isoform X1 n=2 Tax=Girardinichthys multiradiatus TaxID=208333 RepID=UPI001FADB506|nr:axonemal dynein light intermediate polypeptide 1 isoform X1 [Girardinichthys multiradiatus]